MGKTELFATTSGMCGAFILIRHYRHGRHGRHDQGTFCDDVTTVTTSHISLLVMICSLAELVCWYSYSIPTFLRAGANL